MKKTFEILITFLLFNTLLSCEKKEITVKYYPTEDVVNDSSSVVFELDSLKMNFKEFVNKCYELEDLQKQTIVELIDGDTLKKIKIHVKGNGLFYQRNILYVINDSIQKDKNYPLSDLEKIMKKHYLNNGKIDNYPDSADRALVLITLKDNQNVNDLKNHLLTITKAFDEINKENKDSLRLNIFIENLVPPPPPLN
jgi:hypothetical protein